MDMVFTIVTVVFGIVISIVYVIEHWSNVLAIATVILGLAIVFAVSWLTMPVCLFAYGAGIVFLLLGWIERGLTKSSARTFSSNAVLAAVRALKDTVLWGLSGLAIVFVVQLVINGVLSMANGEFGFSALSVLKWQSRVERLHGWLRAIGSPWVFLPTAVAFLVITFRKHSDVAFRILVAAKKLVGRATAALTVIVSFSFVTTEYANHLEGMWRPRWREIRAEQDVLTAKIERRLSALTWLSSQWTGLNEDERRHLVTFVAEMPHYGDPTSQQEALERVALEMVPAIEFDRGESVGPLREPGTFRSAAEKMHDFLAGSSESERGPTASEVSDGEIRLSERRNAMEAAESVTVEAAKAALGSMLPAGMEGSSYHGYEGERRERRIERESFRPRGH